MIKRLEMMKQSGYNWRTFRDGVSQGGGGFSQTDKGSLECKMPMQSIPKG